MEEMLRRVVPILILLAIGFLSKRIKLFSDSFLEGLKMLILRIALPAVLFDAFSTMQLQTSYFWLFAVIFLYCVALYVLGGLLHTWFPKVYSYRYTKGYMTGFEFGMIGVGLFGAIWGADQLWVIMLIAFGHELFVWFYYVLLLSKEQKDNRNKSLAEIFVPILKTPTMIAIVSGIVMNISGLRNLLDGTLVGESVFGVLEMLKPLPAPLILFVIGYTMEFRRVAIGKSMIYIGTRILFVLGLGMGALALIERYLPSPDPLFGVAFYAFILLPAPYILPLYMKDEEEEAFFSPLLVYSTMVSFAGYLVLVWWSLS